MSKKRKILIFTFSGIFIFIIGGWILLNYLLLLLLEGEYRHYDEGLTIEIHNKTGETIQNLDFILGNIEHPNFQKVASIYSLDPDTNMKITSSKIKKANFDLSLFFNYKDNRTSLLYIPVAEPYKIVAVINIINVDNKGNLTIECGGYDSVFQHEMELREDEAS
ncbi:hypothetical protein [Metabacillus fastidiosus]|uniref:Uncharacterized protein n=1 Tax=Metabacillus fastidiosus TaxID=1458 RepID=A0ABU6NYU5_9BACI|nr:hypothetical protein [Metabacillus fastidiosus]